MRRARLMSIAILYTTLESIAVFLCLNCSVSVRQWSLRTSVAAQCFLKSLDEPWISLRRHPNSFSLLDFGIFCNAPFGLYWSHTNFEFNRFWFSHLICIISLPVSPMSLQLLSKVSLDFLIVTSKISSSHAG